MELNDVKAAATTALFESTNIAALARVMNATGAMLEETWLNAENRRWLTGADFQLRAKFLSLMYLEDGYDQGDLANLLGHLEDMLPFARESGSQKMEELSLRLIAFFTPLEEILNDADFQASRIRDHSWNVMTSNLDEAREVREIFKKKIEKAEALPESDGLFGNFRYVDAKGQILSDLRAVHTFADNLVHDLEEADARALLADIISPPSEEAENSEFYPEIESNLYDYAPVVAVSTPFFDELELFVAAYGKQNSTPVKVINLTPLFGKPATARDVLFKSLARSKQIVLIRGIEHYKGDHAEIYRDILAYGKSTGQKVFVLDEGGDKRVYNGLLALTNNSADYSPMDIAFLYLSLPTYAELCEFFEGKGMFTRDDTLREKVRKYLPFSGFVGLNQIIAANARGRDWLEAGRSISDARYDLAMTYISRIPTQPLLLSTDWGDFKNSKVVQDDTRSEIDYDKIRDVNPENIRKIMEGDFSIFEQCGLICRYCLSHGEDVSVWKSLDKKEYEKRLTLATRLVSRILDVPIEPIVTVHKKIGGSDSVHGLCIGGGKEIQYKEAALADFSGTMNTLCHECFHSFQHTASHTPFKAWYWRELGVTRGRIETWVENNSHYFSGDEKKFGKDAFNVYRAQIFESDARAFATDCLFAAEGALQKIDWE